MSKKNKVSKKVNAPTWRLPNLEYVVEGNPTSEGREPYVSDHNCHLCESGSEYDPSEGRPEFRVSDPEEVRDIITNGDEVRVTSSTGGQKGKKLPQLSAIDPLAIMEVAKVAGFGAEKYDKLNFMKGYEWSLSYDAMQRHEHAFWNGQDLDDESGLLHLAHAAWHNLAMISFILRGLGTDDRYSAMEISELQTKESKNI